MLLFLQFLAFAFASLVLCFVRAIALSMFLLLAFAIAIAFSHCFYSRLTSLPLSNSTTGRHAMHAYEQFRNNSWTAPLLQKTRFSRLRMILIDCEGVHARTIACDISAYK